MLVLLVWCLVAAIVFYSGITLGRLWERDVARERARLIAAAEREISKVNRIS